MIFPKLHISLLLIFSLFPSLVSADFFDSLTGTHGNDDFKINISIQNNFAQNQSRSGNFSMKLPQPDDGLLSWGRSISSQVWDQSLESAALEIGITSNQLSEFLQHILETLPENQTISITEILNLQSQAQKVFNRHLSITQQNFNSQVKQLSTETFFDGISDQNQKLDVIFEVMKTEAEWACSKAVNQRRLTITPEMDLEECSGFFCFFLRFENDPTPKYSETDDCIIAHLQWLASYFYQGSKDPKAFLKRPLGLFGDVAAASKGNSFELPDNLPVQFHPVPLHSGKWNDFAGALGGFWDSIVNWGASNSIPAQSDTDDTSGRGKTKLEVLTKASCAKLTGDAKVNCLKNADHPTTTSILASISQAKDFLQDALDWPQDQARNLQSIFEDSQLDTKSICDEQQTMSMFLDIASTTGTNLPITSLQQNAQDLCEGILLGDSSAQKRASALIENSAGISGAIQLKIQTQVLQRLAESIVTSNQQMTNLLKLWQDHKTHPIDPTP